MEKGKYGENTKLYAFRLPPSIADEIKQYIKLRLLQHQKSVLEGVGKNLKGVDVVAQITDESEGIESKEKLFKSALPKSDSKEADKEAIVTKTSSKISFDKIMSLPLGTKEVKSYGTTNGALREKDGVFYTKRTFGGKLEILMHSTEQSAREYADINFK